MALHFYPERTPKIKPENWEREIQGGNPCKICGDNNPCGDITGCAWWTS